MDLNLFPACLLADPEAFGSLVLQGKRPAASANAAPSVQICSLQELGSRRPWRIAASQQPALRYFEEVFANT